MKLNKTILKRIKNVALSVGFVSTFAFGHLIACNSKEVDITPVITVPVQYVLTPNYIDSDTERSVIVGYNFEYDKVIGDYNFDHTIDIELYNSGNNLYLQSTLNYNNFVNQNVVTVDYTFDLGSIYNLSDNISSNIVFDFYYNVPLALVSQNYYSLYYYFAFSYLGNNYNYVYRGDYLKTDIVDEFQSDGPQRDLTDYLQGSFLYDLFVEGFSSYQDGVNYVLTHLEEYDLYDYNQYLAYGQAEYQRGYSAIQNTLSFSAFVAEIFRSPITMFKDAFNFYLPLGNGETINVGGILTFFLTIGIALTVVSLVLKIGGSNKK